MEPTIKRIKLDRPEIEFLTEKTCAAMLKKMETFALKDNNNIQGTFRVLNLVSKNSYNFKTDNMSMEKLRLGFGDTGHCWAVDLAAEYHVPMWFDLDCEECKTTTDGCASPISSATLKSICSTIESTLKKLLGQISSPLVTRGSNTCGIHLYYPERCSLPAYGKLCEAITVELESASDGMCRLRIDSPTTLLLPFGAKRDYHPNLPTPLLGNRNPESYFQSSKYPYFELDSYSFEDNNGLPIGQIIYEDGTSVRVTVPPTLDIKYKTFKDATMANTLEAAFENANSYDGHDPRLDRWIKSRQEKRASRSTKVAKGVNFELDQPEDDDIVHYVMARCFAQAVPPKRAVANFLENLDLENGGVGIYDLIATCCGKHNRDERYRKTMHRVSELASKQGLWKLRDIAIMLAKVGLDPHVGCDALRWAKVLRQLKNFDEQHSSYIFEQKVSLFCTKRQVRGRIFEKVMFEYLDEHWIFVHDRDLYHRYAESVGLYQEIKPSEILSGAGVVSSMIFHECKLLAKQAENDGRGIRAILAKYLEAMPNSSGGFNVYRDFINTKLGVFHTPTGLYCAKTPLLRFTTEKNYCFCSADDENAAVNILDLQIYTEAARLLCFKQAELFCAWVLLPGLNDLSGAQSAFTNTEIDSLVKLVKKFFLFNDQIGRSNFYYMYETVLRAKPHFARWLALTKTVKNNCDKYKIDDLDITFDQMSRGIADAPLEQNLHLPSEMSEMLAMMEHHIIGFDQSTDSWMCATALLMMMLDSRALVPRLPWSREEDTLPICERTLENTPTHLQNKEILFGSKTVSDQLLHVIYSISQMLRFDGPSVKEFMCALTQLYTPGATRKRMLLLVGGTSGGKSTFMRWLTEMNAPSTHSTAATLGSAENGNNGPHQQSIDMCSKYLVVCNEAAYIDAPMLKIITGSDILEKRAMYAQTHTNLTPFAYVVGVSNQLPRLGTTNRRAQIADDAIRSRLALFELVVKFSPSSSGNTLRDYDLRTVKRCSFDERAAPRHLSNLIYATFRDETIMIPSDWRSPILERFMIQNNPLYALLESAGIKFDPFGCIPLNVLRKKVESVLNDKKFSDKFKDWASVKLMLFAADSGHYTLDDAQQTVRGLRNHDPKSLMARTADVLINHVGKLMVPSPEKDITFLEVQRQLFNVLNQDPYLTATVFSAIKFKYADNIANGTKFRLVRMVNLDNFTFT